MCSPGVRASEMVHVPLAPTIPISLSSVIMNIVEGTTAGGLPDAATVISDNATAAVMFAFTRFPPCAARANVHLAAVSHGRGDRYNNVGRAYDFACESHP